MLIVGIICYGFVRFTKQRVRQSRIPTSYWIVWFIIADLEQCLDEIPKYLDIIRSTHPRRVCCVCCVCDVTGIATVQKLSDALLGRLRLLPLPTACCGKALVCYEPIYSIYYDCVTMLLSFINRARKRVSTYSRFFNEVC